MTTPEAGRDFDDAICLSHQHESREAEAICSLRFQLTTQAETIRRLEGEVIKWKAANSVPILESAEGLETIKAVFSTRWAEAMKKAEQRAEAAEGRVRKLEEALRDMLAFGVEFDDERLDYMSVQIVRASIEEARALLTPATGEGEG